MKKLRILNCRNSELSRATHINCYHSPHHIYSPPKTKSEWITDFSEQFLKILNMYIIDRKWIYYIAILKQPPNSYVQV